MITKHSKSIKPIHTHEKHNHEKHLNKVSAQVLCETYNHENWQLSSIFLKTQKSSKLDFFKAYVCQVQTKAYIHI